MSVRPAKTQIGLGNRPVWSESSLCAQWEWVAKDPSFLHARCPGWSESSLGTHSFCWFCHVTAHISFGKMTDSSNWMPLLFWKSNNVKICNSYWYYCNIDNVNGKCWKCLRYQFLLPGRILSVLPAAADRVKCSEYSYCCHWKIARYHFLALLLFFIGVLRPFNIISLSLNQANHLLRQKWETPKKKTCWRLDPQQWEVKQFKALEIAHFTTRLHGHHFD